MPDSATILAHSSSPITRMPSSSAFLSFEPAPGPATTRSVLALTEPAARAPSRSAWALASSRLIVSRLPVKTIVLPLHSVCFASLTNGFGRDFGQQIVERLAVVRLVEEIDQRLGDDRADAFDRRQLRLRILGHRDAAQLLDRAEAFEQVARGDDADVADAEPEQEARPVGLALGLDRGEQIVDRFLLPALAPEQLVAVRVQAEDVGGRMEPAELDELGDRSSRPAPRCRARRATRNAAAARTAAPGRSARRCSGRRPRLPRRPLRCRIRGNGRGRRRARAARRGSDSRPPAG